MPAGGSTGFLIAMSGNPARPTFLYIGMPKAASSWMFEILRQHPEIYVPLAKNVEFFDRNYERGIDWYLDKFRSANGERAVGELSHDYYAVDGAGPRIHRHLPDARLICCLREPGDFLISSFNYARMHELDESLDLAGYAGTTTLQRYLRYKDNLRAFYDLFPAENIKIVFFDDVRSSPRRIVRELYEFLGVDTDFQPAFADRRVNVAKRARSRAVTQLVFSTARLMRRWGMANLVGAVKRSPLAERILYRQGSTRPHGWDGFLSSLRARCRTDYPELERMIGKPLPQSWYEA